MTIFQSSEEVYEVMGTLFKRVLSDDEVGPLLGGLDMTLFLNFSEPTAPIVLNCHGDSSSVDLGPASSEVDLELSMSADTGHRLWLGEMSPMVGLARRKIKAEGNLMKAMGLQSILDPSAIIYKSLLIEMGRSELLGK